MSRELRHIEITCTVHKPEHLPEKNGQQMYADDVITELHDVVTTAVNGWYQRRGHELLACEPDVS